VRNERQRGVLAPRLLLSMLKIQPLLPGPFGAAQLILLSTGLQVHATMAAVVSDASRKIVDSDTAVTRQKHRRDPQKQQAGWDRLMAIATIATGASIAGRRGLFLGHLMLHAPNYDAL